MNSKTIILLIIFISSFITSSLYSENILYQTGFEDVDNSVYRNYQTLNSFYSEGIKWNMIYADIRSTTNAKPTIDGKYSFIGFSLENKKDEIKLYTDTVDFTCDTLKTISFKYYSNLYCYLNISIQTNESLINFPSDRKSVV